MGWVSKIDGRRATGMRVPLARSEELVVEKFEHELLVYDKDNKRAHCLGATAASVWRACDGQTDIDTIATRLDLDRDMVVRAVDELQAAELIDAPQLEVLNGDGNGNGITRRELTIRSTKLGVAAAAAAPFIYSIAVPAPAAAASPTNFQCAIFSVDDCGHTKGAGAVPGCCCCCQGCAVCKVGGSCSMCKMQTCPSTCSQSTGHCSDGSCGGGSTTPSMQGCCGTSGAADCGCAFAQGGTTTTTCASGVSGCTTPCKPGTKGCGAGCCDQTTGGPCTLGSANCVPCCNGVPITSSAAFNCCVPGATSTC